MIPHSALRIPHSGITLIELLVVILILTTLTAAVIPALSPSIESRRTREAVRGLTAFIMGARSRAISTGRPYGVVIERMTHEPGASMRVSYAEVPPPFSGYGTNSRFQVMSQKTPGTLRLSFVYILPGGNYTEWMPADFVQDGDFVQLNYQGVRYKIVRRNTRMGVVDWIEVEISPDFTPPYNKGDAIPYRIFRQPLRDSSSTTEVLRTAAGSFQLPAGTVIDLFASGMGDDFFHEPPLNNNADPIVIMFSPNGSLGFIQHNEGTTAVDMTNERPRTSVSLLIGKREKVSEAREAYNKNDAPDVQAEKHNWKDLENRWITISPRTGQVGTSQVASVVDDLDTLSTVNVGDSDIVKVLKGIRASRRLARDMRSLGGK